jgi:hypothetical protein
MFGIHLKYVLFQLAFVLLLSFAKNDSTNFKQMIAFGLLAAGFWAFPLLAIKRINQIVRPNERRAGPGSWIFQASITLLLLRIFAPISRSLVFMAIGCMISSLILLLFSAKKDASKKRVIPVPKQAT